jgi:hypothetical protein
VQTSEPAGHCKKGNFLEFLRTNAPLLSAISSVGSCCAAAFSAIAAVTTLYFVFLRPPKPFDPQVAFTTPTFETQDGQLSAALALAITNSGGLPGKIEDVALRLRSIKNGRRWDLLPVFLINLQSYHQGAGKKDNLKQSVTSSFSDIALPANGSGNFSLCFLSRDQFDPKDLNPDEVCELILYIRTASEYQSKSEGGKWIPVAQSRYSFAKESLDGLRSGSQVIPVEKSRDELRDNLPRD